MSIIRTTLGVMSGKISQQAGVIHCVLPDFDIPPFHDLICLWPTTGPQTCE